MLTKTASKTKVAKGTSVSYLYNATNTGAVPLTGNITDDVYGPIGSFVNLMPGGWVGFNVSEVLTANTTNVATVNAVTQAGLNITDSAVAFVEVYSDADILLTKMASKTKVPSGTVVSYLYNATNTGGVPLTGNITDDVYGPIGSFVNLMPGGWVGFNVSKVITANTTNVATVTAVDEFGTPVTDSAVAFVQVYTPTIESCDATGIKKDLFYITDNVYVTGTGYEYLMEYDLYLVNDQIVWTDGMSIPTRLSGTQMSVTSNAGNILPTLAWNNPLIPGKYDIIVDVNKNGIYDVGIDAIDDNDIEITAGFFVIPEITFGSAMAAASMFTALGLFAIKKKRKHAK